MEISMEFAMAIMTIVAGGFGALWVFIQQYKKDVKEQTDRIIADAAKRQSETDKKLDQCEDGHKTTTTQLLELTGKLGRLEGAQQEREVLKSTIRQITTEAVREVAQTQPQPQPNPPAQTTQVNQASTETSSPQIGSSVVP
jgi:hypothetical protein